MGITFGKLLFIFLVFAGACMLTLFGCGTEPPEYALILNPSGSNEKQFNSTDFKATIQQVVTLAKFTRLIAVVAAEDPLELTYADCRHMDAEMLMADLENARHDQKLHQPNANPAILNNNALESEDAAEDSINKAKIEMWGWGTDHAEAISRVIKWRSPEKPLVVVLLTDGQNEDSAEMEHPFQQVEREIEKLLKSGKTRIFTLGLSQAIIETEKRKTVLDRWRDAFLLADAENLEQFPDSSRGYYLTYKTDLPIQIAGKGFLKKSIKGVYDEQ